MEESSSFVADSHQAFVRWLAGQTTTGTTPTKSSNNNSGFD